MIKRFLNCMAWLWLAFYGIAYTCIVLTEGMVYTIKNTHCDGVGSFITGVACVVLVTTKFVLPFIHGIEYSIKYKLDQNRRKKMFKVYSSN